MALFVLVFVITALSIAGLGVGVIFGRAALKGTCATGTCSRAFKCSGCQGRKTAEDKA